MDGKYTPYKTLGFNEMTIGKYTQKRLYIWYLDSIGKIMKRFAILFIALVLAAAWLLIVRRREGERPAACFWWLSLIACFGVLAAFFVTNVSLRAIYLFPLYFLEHVGCYCLGFVAGLYQTYEPWEGIWEMVANGTAPADWDLTRWQHDLMRPNYRPYDPKEIAIIKEYSKMADEDFASKSSTP